MARLPKPAKRARAPRKESGLNETAVRRTEAEMGMFRSAEWCAAVGKWATEAPIGSDGARFTRAEVEALSVPDDIVLKLTDDLPDIPDGGRGRRSELPSPFGPGPEEGAAIAVWQRLFPEDRTRRIGSDAVWPPVPKWLWAMGISYHRGWIRHAGPLGPDFVIDWVIPVADEAYDDAYVLHKDGETGPYSPPPPADLQTFADAVVGFSHYMLLDVLNGWFGPGGILADRVREGGRA